MGLFNKIFGKKEAEVIPADKNLPKPKKTPPMSKVKMPTEGKTKGGDTIKKTPPMPKTKASKTPATKKPRAKKKPVVEEPKLSANDIAKAEATARKEPWVTVTQVELDLDNISNGAFNLDWNDYFIAKLIRTGYKGTDVEVVDQWFTDLCRNVIMENFEQWEADPTNRQRE